MRKKKTMRKRNMKRKKNTMRNRKIKLMRGGYKHEISKPLFPGAFVILGGGSGRQGLQRGGAPMEFSPATKTNDGPGPASALLDRLIVAYFEKRNIHSAEDVQRFVGPEELERSGRVVAERLEQIIATLRSGENVGILPSASRLNPNHIRPLTLLLRYLTAALPADVQAAVAQADTLKGLKSELAKVNKQADELLATTGVVKDKVSHATIADRFNVIDAELLRIETAIAALDN